MSAPRKNTPVETEPPEAAGDKPGFSRIRVTPETAELFRAFQDEHGVTTDEGIKGLIDFYRTHTQYRFSAETGNLLADIRKLDATVASLIRMNFTILELDRSIEQAECHGLANQIEAPARQALGR